MSWFVRIAVVALLAVVLPATSSLAQASGYVRVKLLKAGLIVGAGGGSGVLTYRGRDYPFRVSGLSLGVTAGASVSRLEGTGVRHQASQRLRRHLQLRRWRRRPRWRLRRRSAGEREGRNDCLARAQGGAGVRYEPQRGQDFTEVSLLGCRQLVLPSGLFQLLDINQELRCRRSDGQATRRIATLKIAGAEATTPSRWEKHHEGKRSPEEGS